MRRAKANGIIETGLIAGLVAVLVFATSAGINKNYQKWAGLSGVTVANSASGSASASGKTSASSSTGTGLGSSSVASSSATTGKNVVGVETAGSMGGVGTSAAMVTSSNGQSKIEEISEAAGNKAETKSLWEIIVGKAKEAVATVKETVNEVLASASNVAPTPQSPINVAAEEVSSNGKDKSIWDKLVETAKNVGEVVVEATERTESKATTLGKNIGSFLGL
jgi:hypothetical protein